MKRLYYLLKFIRFIFLFFFYNNINIIIIMEELKYISFLKNGYLDKLNICKYNDNENLFVSKPLPRGYCDLILDRV